jgi:SAM-dependent methyltransferase
VVVPGLMPMVRSLQFVRVAAAGSALAVLGDSLRLRRRLAALAVLDHAATRPRDQAPDRDPVVVLGVEGGCVDSGTVAAAAAHLHVHGLQAVDLVPGDAPTEELLDLVRLSDPRVLRRKTVPMGRGAGQALVVRHDLAERAGLSAGTYDPVEMRRAFTQAKRYAPHGCDQAIAPRLRAVPLQPEQRLAVWRAQYGRLLAMLFPLRVLPAGAAVGAALAGTPAGATAIAAAVAVKPALVTAGSDARPRDRTRLATTAARLAAEPRRLASAAGGGWRPARPAHTDPAFIDSQRDRYRADLEAGVARFLASERHDCPVCGGTDIRRRVQAPDMVQCKPGTFRVDVCGGCGTCFQNPPLTSEGLDFYYRDFYDGLGEDDTEMMFSADDRLYLQRAGMVGEHTRPKRWLDVGGGHGHFCVVASGLYPDTRFELFDQAQPVDEAIRRGWVADGHSGTFPAAARALEGAFDVVTMFHYLEHTPDPLAELDAAHRVLEPGGILAIEVPAPECRLAGPLGWAWGPWMQPQHLHLLPLHTMVDQLERRGFEIVDTDRTRFYSSWDLSWAAFQVVTRLAPGPDAPWTPPRSRAHRAARLAAFGAAGPFLGVALALDKLVLSRLAKLDGRLSSVYSVIARRTDGTRP